MFTGIVQAMGRVSAIDSVDFGVRISIDARGWDHRPEAGASIAVNGCCLTVASGEGLDHGLLAFDVIQQTLDLTTMGRLVAGDRINLEHAVTPSTMLGGHIVQGHIDGVGDVIEVQRGETEWRVRIEPPAAVMAHVITQGSIAMDGVSLTIASAQDSSFEVALIPTTLRETTLGSYDQGRRVNLESDYVARMVVHWLERQRAHQPT